ncbi:HlyD family efflux transporter periplasmic adaptor subunit [Sulfidibacter corallicola]|uniref:HlyD family efflux transporter periplasmic adaptor subunit n=1 Tax=Sulfidibacter corallicola TaxID=2818388 RepID=A0A8A4TJT7_SULCO|nr:HlyD family efflux transporter periplasmic adaptor subunit [Sulfidibacter corallicola]QTD49853.1 HlyD family efflux transporter periplasmic adaptor subunit [Sulfidibacter corallicola]
MDRPIDPGTRRNQAFRKAAWVLLGFGALVLGSYLFRRLLTPSLSLQQVRTSVVRRGPIHAGIQASGTVLPQTEHIITSPLDTRVTGLRKKPGEAVRAGEPILDLDLGDARLELDKLTENISLKRKQREQKALESEHRRIEADAAVALKKVELEGLEAVATRKQTLLDNGLISQGEWLEAHLDVKKARIELKQRERSLSQVLAEAVAAHQAIDLEISVLQKERQRQEGLLELATARADHDGVITQIVEKEGTSVTKGQELARIADLDAFRVEAGLSDLYTQRLNPGQSVQIRVGDRQLTGTLSQVLPTIENGAARVTITLDEPRQPDLHANQRVDVLIVTGSREEALVVDNGPFLNGSGTTDVFVLRDGQARRTAVEIGLVGFDLVEIVSGLQDGETIITSDMRRFAHMEHLPLQ